MMMRKKQIPSLGYLITKIGRLISKDYAVALEQIHLTPLQAGIIMNLAVHKQMTQVELMGAVVIDKASINQMLKSLSQDKLITMSKDSDDRRRLRISLSKRGRELLPKITEVDEVISKKYANLFGKNANAIKNIFWEYYRKRNIDFS